MPEALGGSSLVSQDAAESSDPNLPCIDPRAGVRAHWLELDESVLLGSGLIRVVFADTASDESILANRRLCKGIPPLLQEGSGPGDAMLARSLSGDGSPDGVHPVAGEDAAIEAMLDLTAPGSGDNASSLRCTAGCDASSGLGSSRTSEGNSGLLHGVGLSSSVPVGSAANSCLDSGANIVVPSISLAGVIGVSVSNAVTLMSFLSAVKAGFSSSCTFLGNGGYAGTSMEFLRRRLEGLQ